MIKCPKCGSGSVKKSSAIYEQGISRSQGRTSGTWFSRRGPGVWSGRSTSERISGAAARNAPTGFELEALTFCGVFFVTLLVGFFSAGSVGSFFMAIPIALIIAIAASVWVGISQKEQRALARARYDRQWYCSKCGSKFEVDLEQPRTAGDAGAATGPSQGPMPRSNGPRSEYASRILSPVQRAKAETERDRTWLRAISQRADAKTRSFDPCRPTPLDLGAVSRLASLGFLQYDHDRDDFSLTDMGMKRAAQIDL